MITKWETVRIFISSTFEDMHAERDYLIKQVFPELREWCENRKLNLVDIDLRWGVKEEDTQNKNVVEVCLKRIDDARPFFLCFLGQRRGWVPQIEDVSANTFMPGAFPDLRTSIANNSVTEMEIMHALIHPFHGDGSIKGQSSQYHDPAKYAFFYLRNPSFLNQEKFDLPSLKKIYTNEGISNPEELQIANQQLKNWREEKIPELCKERNLPLYHYSANWNYDAVSPELLLPLACPSLIPANQKRWQNQWLDAGIVTQNATIEEPDQVIKAQAFNKKRTSGRLTDFEVEGIPLRHIVLADLKRAISDRFPEHIEVDSRNELQKEIDQQEQFLQICREGYISRGDDFIELNQYIVDDRKHVLILTADGGVGKSTLLANWVDDLRSKNEANFQNNIYYRFIGQSDRSNNLYSLLFILLSEINEITGFQDGLPESLEKMKKEFPELLKQTGQRGKTVIVLDALNQLETGISDLSWLPWQLPENIKLIVSFKRGDANAEELLNRLRGQVTILEVKPFINVDDRRKLVRAYLSQYLKDLDEQHIEALIHSPGAGNPLFLKVALSELRVFGAFSNLGEKIKRDFGDTPITAFNGLLNRLEEDPVYALVDPRKAVPVIFGLLAHARNGLSVMELTSMLIDSLGLDATENNISNIMDAVYLFLRQVRLFVTHRDGRFDFFYESFKMAVLQRYENLYNPTGWHLKLAQYFEKLPIWMDQLRLIPSKRKISELPYHLAMSGQYQQFQYYMTEFEFLMAKVVGMGAPALLEDFRLKDHPAITQFSKIVDEVTLLERAISLSLINLQKEPLHLAGQLIARLGDRNSPILEKLLIHAGQWSKQPWIKPLTFKFNKPEIELQASYSVSNQFIINMLPTSDGKALIVLSQETNATQLNLKRIDALSGNVIHQISLNRFITHADMQLSKDGQRVVVVTTSNLLIYNSETLTLENDYPINGVAIGANINFLRLSPDDRFAFVVEQKKISQICLQNGIRERQFNIDSPIQSFIFSPSGKFAALCLGGGRYLETSGPFSKEDYYNYNNCDQLYVVDLRIVAPPILINRNALCDSLIFSSDEDHLVCVNEMGRVETWQLSEAKLLGSIQVLTDQQVQGVMQGFRFSGNAHSGIAKIVPSADNKRAICSFGSAYMATLNLEYPGNVFVENNLYSPGQVMKLIPAYDVYALSLSPTKEIIVWNIETGKMVSRLKDNSFMRDFLTAKIGNKDVVFSKNDENYIRLWDISNLSNSAENQAPASLAQTETIYDMKKSPLDDMICVSKTMTVQFFDTKSGGVIRDIKTAPPPLLDMHYQPEAKCMVLVFIDGSVKILSLMDFHIIKTLKLQHLTSSINSSKLSPDGKWLLYGDKSNTLKMINLESGEEYAFEENYRLNPEQSPRNTNYQTLFGGAPGWGKSQIIIQPEFQQVLSFSYIPIEKGNQDFVYPGKMQATDSWGEIHDLKTGKLTKRVSSPENDAVVLKSASTRSTQSIVQLIVIRDPQTFLNTFSLVLSNPQYEKHEKIIERQHQIIDFSVRRDEMYLALVNESGSLEFVDKNSGETIAEFRGDTIFTCCEVLEDGITICTGDEHGSVNFFQVDNVVCCDKIDRDGPVVNLTDIACDWQAMKIQAAASQLKTNLDLPIVSDSAKKQDNGFLKKFFKKI